MHLTYDSDDARLTCVSSSAMLPLVSEVERLIKAHRPFLEKEMMVQPLENLKNWLEANYRYLYAAPKLTETGFAWLSDICYSLKLMARRRRILEKGGGSAESVQLLQTIDRLEKILAQDSPAQPHSKGDRYEPASHTAA